jgi:hypothetical protein
MTMLKASKFEWKYHKEEECITAGPEFTSTFIIQICGYKSSHYENFVTHICRVTAIGEASKSIYYRYMDRNVLVLD